MALGIAAVGTLSACTSVDFRQLRAQDLKAQAGSPMGAVYYLPKPYLLVAELPPPTPSAASDEGSHKPSTDPEADTTKKGVKRGGSETWPSGWEDSGSPSMGGAEAKGDAKEDSGTPGASSSDQSFVASTDTYTMKIIYLPDLSRPMAMSVRAGIGTASLKPTLQNGWMLTGFDASADSKTAELLSSVAEVITSIKTPGKSDEGKGGGAGTPPVANRDDSRVLRPGLYEFHYDYDGRLVGLCPVTYFAKTGAIQQEKTSPCV